MTRIRRISNSEIQTYKECPRKWWLAWHRGLRPRRVSPLGALAIGTRIHAALAGWYVPEGEKPRDPLVTLTELLAEASKSLMALNATPEEYKIFTNEANLQEIMLEGYMEWVAETGADEPYEVIESESYEERVFMEIPLLDLRVLIIGRLDVRLRRISDGAIMFLDHKTTASILQSIKGLRMNPQMRIYRTLLHGDTNAPGGAIYSMIRKVKRSIKANPPFYHREELTFNPHELVNFRRQLQGSIHKILADEENLLMTPESHHTFVPPTPGSHCSYCPFERACPMFDDGSRVEDFINENFVVGEALEYYGREDLTRHG